MLCEDRVALVTGASGGICRSVALTLAREGASVIVNYRSNEKEAQAVLDCIQKEGGKAIAVQADIQTEKGCQDLVDAGEKEYGRIDICIISPGGGFTPAPFDKLDAEEAILDVTKEVAPAFRLMRLVLPGMYKHKWGRIIGMGQHPTKTYQPAFAHNAAKDARSALLKLAAEGETWSKGITVNNISPSPVEVCKTIKEAIEQCTHGKAWTDRKTTTGQDIAEAIAFLCSEAGRFITGCVLPFDHRD
ncbi:SDR family NAD(P)-dependent oxidoreductase [Planctomycetota bacterium]